MGNVRVGRSRGITLVELLVVLVILSVALSLVVPSLGKSYETWMLRSVGRKALALFRFASDTARRDGTDIAGYYSDHRLVLLRKGSIFKELDIPSSISVRPEKPGGAVFLPTGQIITSGQFVIENERGRKMIVEVGPLPGQINMKEVMQ